MRFIDSDWYAALAGETFDLIVSNPPYIASGDVHLSQGDLRFEPVSALTDHADGLADLRTIVAGAAPELAPGGWLLLEHGYDQAAPCAACWPCTATPRCKGGATWRASSGSPADAGSATAINPAASSLVSPDPAMGAP